MLKLCSRVELKIDLKRVLADRGMMHTWLRVFFFIADIHQRLFRK